MGIINKNTVDGNLAQALLEAFNEYTGTGVRYAVSAAFPEILVNARTGRFPIGGKENSLQLTNVVKAPGALPAEINIYTREGTWAAEDLSVSVAVPDGDSVFGFAAHEAAIQTLWSKIWNYKEARASMLLFGSSVASTPSSGNLRNDVNSAKEKVYAASGLVPNALIVSYPAYLKLINSAEFLALFPGATQLPEAQRAEMLPSMFGLSSLILSTAAYSPEDAPADVSTISSIFPDDQLAVAVVAPAGSGLGVPSAGRTFRVLVDSDRSAELVSQYDPHRAATIHTIHVLEDIKLIEPKMVHRITGI